MKVARTPQNRPMRVALEANDMDRSTLASMVGLHAVTIQRVIAGQQTLSAATAARVAAILGSTPAALGLVKGEGGTEQ